MTRPGRRPRHRGISENREVLTGFPAPSSPHVIPLQSGTARPVSTKWVSDELLTTTQKVWSEAYGRTVSEEEAMEILTNVKNLAEALMKAEHGGDTE